MNSHIIQGKRERESERLRARERARAREGERARARERDPNLEWEIHSVSFALHLAGENNIGKRDDPQKIIWATMCVMFAHVNMRVALMTHCT